MPEFFKSSSLKIKDPRWPVYYADNLIVGNINSNIGICTLWIPKEKVANNLNKNLYAVIGNLYSSGGINFIIRNILANPKIRYILLWGTDATESGEAFLRFIKAGEGVRLDKEIPREAVRLFRDSVEVIDARSESIRALEEKMKSLPKTIPFTKPQIFPEAKTMVGTLPSEKSGFIIQEEKVAIAWLKLLNLIFRFGVIKPSDYGVDQKELLNMTTVITDEDPKKIFFPKWLPFSKKQLANYYPRVLSGQKIPGVSYTYGGRLRDYRGVAHDQIKEMIQKLRQASHTRRAVAVTWDPLEDGSSQHPPCLIQLLANIQNQKLYLTAIFRSHDIYGAWPENSFALIKLQEEISKKLKVKQGSLTVISNSAHIYTDKWQETQEILQIYYPQKLAWREDPRGNFEIRLAKGRILVEHLTPEGKTGYKFEGTKASEIYKAIINAELVSLSEHAAYLGKELTRAEQALKERKKYIQDKA